MAVPNEMSDRALLLLILGKVEKLEGDWAAIKAAFPALELDSAMAEGRATTARLTASIHSITAGERPSHKMGDND